MNTSDDQPDVQEQQSSGAGEQSNEPEVQDQGQQPDTFDRAYVEKLLKEAAKYRNQAKELEPLAQKMRELEESKKTDLEKAQERIAELEAAPEKATAQATRTRVAAATGVPVELLPAGGDEESLTAAAEALVSWAKGQEPEVKKLPQVNSVGRAGGGDDRDGLARQILGV